MREGRRSVGRRGVRAGSLLGAALIALLGAHLLGERADAAKNASLDPDELLYLPEGRLLRVASLGHPNLLADAVWLRAIQYYGEQRLTTRNYDQTERLFTAIYDLDPTFVGATRFGALILAQDAQDPASALRLLRRAASDFPEAWEYPFDEGFIQHTVVRDYSGAGESYRRAAALPGAPEVAERLAGLSFAKLGDRESAREIWVELLQDGNPMTRSLAERNLKNLDLADQEEELTRAVHAFREERDRIPENWEELIRAGELRELPADPWGGQFFFVPDVEEVLSSTTIDRRMVAVRGLVQGSVESYRGRTGRAPDSLGVLLEEGLITEWWHPFGLPLDYDRDLGQVAWNPPWPATDR